MYLLICETKIVQFEPLVSFCSFNTLQISIKTKKASPPKDFFSIYLEVFFGTWPNFTIVKYNLKISNIYHHIKFRRSIMNRCSIKKLFLKILQYSKSCKILQIFFNENVGLQSCNFFKKRLQHRCFPVNIAKFLRTPVLKNICQRLFERFRT